MMSEPNETSKLISDNPYAGTSAVQSETDVGEPNLVRKRVKPQGKDTQLSVHGSSGRKNPSKKKISHKRSALAKNIGPGIVPQRASRSSQKLRLLPENLDYEPDLGDAREISLKKIKDTPARKDAERLGKRERSILPRVTAYCTAGSYRMRDLIRWLQGEKRIHSTAPKLFDECIYTPFAFKSWKHTSHSNWNILQRLNKGGSGDDKTPSNFVRFDEQGGDINLEKLSTDLFIFEYGVIVMWGFTRKEERVFLRDLSRFETDKLSDEDVQSEDFNYYVTQSYQPRIYNDFISLRDDSNYMTKLSISYAISQSVKISLFEELVDNTIEDTQDIPQQITETGKVEMTKDEIMKSIGELFILRININLHGAILDSPELMWSEPELEPIYQATRGYMEINQRVTLLNQRLEVIADLLQMLKDQLTHSDDEQLEMIVIILIAAEVCVSMVNIIVDLIAERH